MNSLIKKLSSFVLPGDQLLPLMEGHLSKKHKKRDLPWVEMVKRLLSRAADEDSKVLFENASTLIRMHLDETVRKGLKNPSQLSQKYSDILNSLLTHLHFTMEDVNLQVVDMHILSPLILAGVIDMSIAAHKKGEEASVVAKIFMKLTMILGHSQEQLLDALLHCRTLTHPSSRQPSIHIPLIKRLFSSIRSGQTMAPVLYLKYLLLGKLLLFMTEKKDLGKTRTYIAKIFRLPEGVPEWAEKERIPWLGLSQWNTRLILKSMTLLEALQTFYGDRHEEIVISRGHQGKRETSSATLPPKIKSGPSKANTSNTVDGKVNTENSEEFLRPPFSEMSGENLEQELHIVNDNNCMANKGALPFSTRTTESVKKQKNKRKSVEALAQKGKKRKLQNNLEEDASLSITTKSTLLEKTESGPSKSSVDKSVCGKKKTGRTCYKITEESPKMLISEVASEERRKEHHQIVDVNNHLADEGTQLSNKMTVESLKKKGAKRKSVEAVVQKSKKRKHQHNKEEEETDEALTNKTHKKKHKTLQKGCKKTSSTKIGDSDNSKVAYIRLGQSAESVDEPAGASGFMLETEDLTESNSFNHPVERQLKTLKKSCKKKSRRKDIYTLMDKEDLRDKISTNSCMFEDVFAYYADTVSLGEKVEDIGRGSSRKQKLSKKQRRMRRKSMTFIVTDMETKTDNLGGEEFENVDCKDNEDLNVNEINEMEAVNVVPTGKQNTMNLEIVDTVTHKEIDWNYSSSVKHHRLHYLSANRCDAASEDSSDYDRSYGEEGSNLESCKDNLVSEHLKNKEEEENLSKVDSGEDQTVHKRDSEQEDVAKNSSENSDESDKGTVLEAKCSTSKVAENDSNSSFKEHQFNSFVIDSDTDSNSEEVKVECENTENDITVDGVNSNEEREDEIIVENASNEMNIKCDGILNKSNRSDIFVKMNDKIPSNTSEKLVKKSHDNSKGYENVSDEEITPEGEIIITKCTSGKVDNKDIKMDNTEEVVDLISTDQDEDGKNSVVTADEPEVIEHRKHLNVDEIEDPQTSNSFKDVRVPDKGYETKPIMDKVTSETNEPPQYTIYDDDSDILVTPDTDQNVISFMESNKMSTDEDTKNYIELKEEPVVMEVENLLKVKEEREIKTSLIDVKDKHRTALLPHHTCCKDNRDVSQDPVSKMINNLYKPNSVKVDDEENGDNNQIENSKILSGQQHDTLEFKASPASTSDDDEDDKSVIIMDDSEEIETMLQNIVKDTGRLASIQGLRERLLSEMAVKEEHEDSGYKMKKDDKEPSRNSEISPSCVPQVITSDFVSHQSLESTGSMKSKSLEYVHDTEDTESLLQSIVKDAGQLADIRKLRERLLSKAAVTEKRIESSEQEADKNGKEAAKDSETVPCDSQVRKAEDISQNPQCKDVDEVSLNNDTLSCKTSAVDTPIKKDGLKDEVHIIVEEEFKKHLSVLSTENNSSILNNCEAENIYGRNRCDTRDKEQESSDSEHFQDELNKSQTEEPVSIASNTESKENNVSSSDRIEAIGETSSKASGTESTETDETKGLSNINAPTNGNLSLAPESNNTETESVMEESRDKSTEGADEAYEASSDASEDPAPRTRRRSRSLRKSCTHQELQQASDSDSSPVRAAYWRAAADSANHQRSRRKRSQSCSLDSMSPTLETHNRTPSLENSENRTFTVEKEYSFNKTFTVEDNKVSYSEASTVPKDTNCGSSKEKLFVASNEIRQNVLPTESNEDVNVKHIKLSSSEDVPEPHKSESDLLCGNQRRKSQDTPLPSVKVVLNETTQHTQNDEPLDALTLAERSISPSSDTTSTEPFNEPSHPDKINSDDVSEVELLNVSKNGVPGKLEGTGPESCIPQGETTNKPAILSNENSCKSQDCEILITVPEKGNQKSLSDIKEIENAESHSESVRLEEHDASNNVRSAQDIEDGTEHEEIRREIHHSERLLDNDLNQEMAEEFYEGEEVEVLSTSGIEEEDEGEAAGMTPESFKNNDSEARKPDVLISRKSLRSHIRQLYLTKDRKDVNTDSGSKDARLTHIPVVKAQCLSEVALTKEVLISPDVSDEECELVSPGIDLTDVKFPLEVDNLEDNVPNKNVSLCLSNISLQKNNGGINSPHKTIPEEQDESTISKSSSRHLPKASPLKRSKTMTTPTSLSIPSTEKVDDKNIRTRRSSRGVTGEGSPGSPQIHEIPKSAKSNSKLSKSLSSIQEEHAAISDAESILHTLNKSPDENKDQKTVDTVTDTPKEVGGSHDSLSSHCIDKGSKGKKLHTISPCSIASTEKELNGNKCAFQEKILISPQHQNPEHLCENLDGKHKPERCKVTRSQSAKNSVLDALGEHAVLEENKGAEMSHLSSHTEEESSVSVFDTPHQSVTRPKGLSLSPTSSTSSSSSPALLQVRRSLRLKKQPNDLSLLNKDSRINTGSSNTLSESEQEAEEAKDKSVLETPKKLRRSVRSGGTPRKAPNETRLLTE